MDAVLAHHRRHQRRGSDVERGIVDGDACRRRDVPNPQRTSSAARCSMRMSFALGVARVECAAWRRDVERNSVMVRRDRQRVCPDLVRHVAVGGDAIRAHDIPDRSPRRAISEAAAPSANTQTGIPARSSSHAVNRAPWSSGRVSSGVDVDALALFGCDVDRRERRADPAVASAPVLQCVRMRAPFGISVAPCSPIAPAHRAILVENSRRLVANHETQPASVGFANAPRSTHAIDAPTRDSPRWAARCDSSRAPRMHSLQRSSRSTSASSRRATVPSPPSRRSPARRERRASRSRRRRRRRCAARDDLVIGKLALVDDAHARPSSDQRTA